MKKRLMYNSKKGLSTIVTTLLIVGISIVAIGIVWASANKLIKGQINNSEACYNMNDKVQLNSKNTCYEEDDGNYTLRFEVEVKDVNLSGLIVSIGYGGESIGYTLNTTNQEISGLVRYPITVPAKELKVPGLNQGFSYRAGNFTSIIDSIEVTPLVEGVQCGVSDSLADIDNCALLV